MDSQTLLGIVVGIALAAAAGFRVFVPLLVVSIATHTGHFSPSPGFEWIGSTPALVGLAVATVVEVAGYYVPWVDHVLDVIATPAAVLAGTIVMASSVVGLDPFLQWTLALVAGGGAAGLIQVLTGLARLASTSTTGGLGNPIVATVEAGGSIVLSVLALAAPFVAAVLLVMLLWLGARRIYQGRRRG